MASTRPLLSGQLEEADESPPVPHQRLAANLFLEVNQRIRLEEISTIALASRNDSR